MFRKPKNPSPSAVTTPGATPVRDQAGRAGTAPGAVRATLPGDTRASFVASPPAMNDYLDRRALTARD